MYHARSDESSFNPEKFLAADAESKAIGLPNRKRIALHRVLALGHGFKEQLLARLEQEHPELFRGGIDLHKQVEWAGTLEESLRSAIAREGLEFSEDVFTALHGDFLHALGVRFGVRKPGEDRDRKLE